MNNRQYESPDDSNIPPILSLLIGALAAGMLAGMWLSAWLNRRDAAHVPCEKCAGKSIVVVYDSHNGRYGLCDKCIKQTLNLH